MALPIRLAAVKAAVTGLLSRLEANPRLAIAVVLGLTVLLRVPFLDAPLQPDEGGFLMVAKQWNDEGSALYGDQWVDRPPLLLLVFRVAAFLGGSTVTLRLLAILFGILTVVAAGAAGRIINGARGGVAAAVVAAAVSSSYVYDGFALTGESIAVTFVMSSCALLLNASYVARSGRQALLLAFGAGTLATMAFLVKQNFVDAGLFAAVFLGGTVRQTWRLLVAAAVGMAVPLVITAEWARSDDGPGLVRLWHALFRFREQALSVVADAATSIPWGRLAWLIVLFVATGLMLLCWLLVTWSRGAASQPGLRPALLVMLGYGLVSVLAGVSWWNHYLLQFGPVLAMGAALATRRPLIRERVHQSIGVVAGTSILTCLFGLGNMAVAALPGSYYVTISDYLRQASRPGDSVVVTYGSPSVIEMSGLSTPYRYSWNLTLRVRDPHLRTLVATLTGPRAPTWLVEIDSFNAYGLDTAAFRQVRATRYHVVATVCGRHLFLRDGVIRRLPPVPACP
jgi:hypothetical protein